MMKYETRYRERVLEYIAEGHTQVEAAKVFKVNRKTIYDWIRLREDTGSLAAKPATAKFVKIPPDRLIEYVGKHPDAYLREIAAEFGCTGFAVHKALKRVGITRKKN